MDLNNSGVIVGESDNSVSRAFRWDPINGMVGLTGLAGDNDRGVATGINDAGVIVGFSSNGNVIRPARWVNGIAQDLGSLDGVNTRLGRAWSINENGVVVGVSSTGIAGVSSKATMWREGNIINLGAWQANSYSEARSVNNLDTAVGTASNGTTASGTSIQRATRWEIVDGSPVLTDLGSLGLTFSEARSINDLGQIVGFATNISGFAQRAFLWENGVLVDLNDWIDPSLGWTLRSAESINNRGDIVGWGTFGGQTRAYMLINTVPEPSASLLLAVGGVILARRRRR
jgi:probable HAF family extracellular repeat protein